MKVFITTEVSGEIQFDMSEADALRLIGAATMYGALIKSQPAAAVYDEALTAVREYANQPEVKPEKPASKVERMFGNYHSRIPVSKVLPSVPKPIDGNEETYRGFLLIRCAGCGKLRGFYAKNPQSTYYCECGSKTHLRELRPLFLHCNKCGNCFKYMTNVTDTDLTYDCLECGSPVDLELNRKGDAFVTVGHSHF